MEVVKDIGLLCKQELVGEKSSRCLFVTNEYGKLWTTAFNVAQTKSQLRGILVPPAFLEIELVKSKKNLFNLSNASEIDLYPLIKTNLVNNILSQYFIEILTATSFFEQSDQVILQLTVNTLKALENGADPKLMLVNFIWRALGLHYALPDFSSDIFLTKQQEILIIRNLIKSPWNEIIKCQYSTLFNYNSEQFIFCINYGNRELESYIEHQLLSFKFAKQQIQTLL